jgi:hypothetical protein
MYNIQCLSHPQTYISLVLYQYKIENKLKNNKINHSFVGCTIAFSVCNKLFKPLSIPRGRVKSCEGLTGMIPINIVPTMLSPKMERHKNHGSHSLASLTKQTPSSQF